MIDALTAADLVHLGYALMLVALLARDVLWLRAILVAAQSTLAAYAWFTDRPSMAAWNALFVLINFIWVLRILHERRAVELPPELRDLHRAHFSAFSAPEFLRFWNSGVAREEQDGVLATTGQQPEALLFLVKGAAEVRAENRRIATLPAGSFIAEMSLLTAAAASADVIAIGTVQLRCWPMAELRSLAQRQPAMWTHLQSALGQDLVAKIRRQSATAH